ncbi:RNA polymerase sigma factor [Leucobacter sp. GX24907]
MEDDRSTHDAASTSSEIDAALLTRLRNGDDSAYTALWTRHIDAALTLARNCVSQDAEDLASEAFLRVYHQVTVSGNGPQQSFRAYLFTVIRNLAAKWEGARNRTITGLDVEVLNLPELVDAQDGLAALNGQAEADEVLEAFRALPERWQRVLWLVEIEDASHKHVAAELEIKPNAVAALLVRARKGLKREWLTAQIPPHLRTDDSHTAALLPEMITSERPLSAAKRRRIESHLPDCDECHILFESLRATYQSTRSKSLKAYGFAALAGAIPASKAGPLVDGGTAAGVTTLGGGGALLVGGMTGAGLLIGGVLVAGLTLGNLFPSVAWTSSDDRSTSSTSTADPGDDAGKRSGDRADDAENTSRTHEPWKGVATTIAPEDGGLPAPEAGTEDRLGRGNTNPDIPEPIFTRIPEQMETLTRPQPLGPDDDSPGPRGSGDDSSTELTPGLSTPRTVEDYHAPVLAGHTSSGASVIVEFENARYAPTVAENGSWSFDLRLLSSRAGTYEYTVWAFTETDSSLAETGSFTLLPVDVRGLLPEIGEQMLIDEARSTGVVIEVTGPAAGAVCLALPFSDEYAVIDLGESGTTRIRLRFFENGFYALNFRVCSDEYFTVSTERFVAVEDPDVLWEPWAPDPTLDAIEIEVLADL